MPSWGVLYATRLEEKNKKSQTGKRSANVGDSIKCLYWILKELRWRQIIVKVESGVTKWGKSKLEWEESPGRYLVLGQSEQRVLWNTCHWDSR